MTITARVIDFQENDNSDMGPEFIYLLANRKILPGLYFFLHPVLLIFTQAISLVEKGICSAEAVDDVVRKSFGRRLAELDPLENADLVGIELKQDIHKQVLPDMDNQTAPSAYLQTLIDSGWTGITAGGGYRDWSSRDLQNTKAWISEHLRKLENILPD